MGESKFSLIPGTGAGSSGTLISLLLARGEKFRILLDDDRAGKTQAARYSELYFLPSGVAVTIGDIDPRYRNLSIEGLLSDDTLTKIAQRFERSEKASKKEIALYFAEANWVSSGLEIVSEQSLGNISGVLNHLAASFSV